MESRSAYFQCSFNRLPLQLPGSNKDRLVSWLMMKNSGFELTETKWWSAPIHSVLDALHFSIVGIPIGYHCFPTTIQHYHKTTPCVEFRNPHMRAILRFSQIHNQTCWKMIFEFEDTTQFVSPTYFVGNSFLQFLRTVGRLPILNLYLENSSEVLFIIPFSHPCFLLLMSTQIIREAVEASYPLAVHFLEQKHETLELESRIGCINQRGKFIPGVKKEFFFHWLEKMEAHNEWISVQDWTNSIDFLWANSVRATKTDDSDETKMQCHKKKLLKNVTFECPENTYDIRLSLKTETPQTDMPEFPHRLVRVKRRKVFNHKNIVLFCFTYISEAKEKITAIQNGERRYEIEFELLNTEHCKSRKPRELIASLLEKTVDFLGRDKPYSLRLVQ